MFSGFSELIIFAITIYVIRCLNRTDTPKIKGIPEPRGWPILGNILQLGQEHAKNARALAKRLGPVFQVRLGNRRIVYVNSFASVRHFWISNQSSLISRPKLYTFHSVVSTSQGFTIGTSPWDESCKRRRKAAATALNRPAVQTYMPIVDEESTASIKELVIDSKHGEIDIDPNAYFQRFALNTSLELAYGYRVDSLDSELLQEIVHVERVVSNVRSTSNNWQDYLPILRLAFWSNTNKTAEEYRIRRDKYMTLLLDILQEVG
jgi:phenylacetate 2-hydroxylase